LLSIIMKGTTAMKRRIVLLSVTMKGRTSTGPLIKNLFLKLHQVSHLFQSGQYGSVISVTLNRVRTKGGVAHVNLGEGSRGSLKMSKPTKKDNETPKISAAGKKRIHLLQQHCLMFLPVPVCQLTVMTCSVH